MKKVTVQLHSNHAMALLKDLQKVNVLTILEMEEDNLTIPDWQQKLVLQRIEDARKNPSLLVNWADVKNSI